MAVTAVLVEDDDLLRSALGSALERHGVRVTGAFANAAGVAAHVDEEQPDVALLDLDLGPGPTGIDVARALRKARPAIGLVILTTYDDPRLQGDGMPTLPPGTAYLSKGRSNDVAEVARAIHAAARSPLRPPKDAPPEPLDLTAAQIDVLRLVAEGLSTPEIAERRGVTTKAVEQMLTKIYQRLDLPKDPAVNQRVQLTRAYLKAAGFVD